MNFQTHNQKEVETLGTSLLGEIVCDYNKLKKLFGKPHSSDEYKVDAEWDIEFENGEVATIYNWKNGKNYNGKNGLATSKITDWHIGGHRPYVVALIKEVLNA